MAAAASLNLHFHPEEMNIIFLPARGAPRVGNFLLAPPPDVFVVLPFPRDARQLLVQTVVTRL